MIGAQAGVMSDVPAGSKKAWTPALDQVQALRVVGEILRLPKLASKVKELARRLERLEASKDHS
jgi:UDP-3-O-[3-hydroxymyristoyl] glucosamine N-acyltransferase